MVARLRGGARGGLVRRLRGADPAELPPGGAAASTGRSSLELTLAGVVATRVFSAGGAGGIAFTAWVLHRAGMDARADRAPARRVHDDPLLRLHGRAADRRAGRRDRRAAGRADRARHRGRSRSAAIVVALVLLTLKIPGDLERRVEAMADESGRARADRDAAGDGAAGRGQRGAADARDRARNGRARSSGRSSGGRSTSPCCGRRSTRSASRPRSGTIVLCYFLGSLGNLLPLPGGVGGTEGGMLGAFAASGVDAGLALLAVVSYQVISTYLPAVPGLFAAVAGGGVPAAAGWLVPGLDRGPVAHRVRRRRVLPGVSRGDLPVGVRPAGVHPGQGADPAAHRAHGPQGWAAPAACAADPRAALHRRPPAEVDGPRRSPGHWEGDRATRKSHVSEWLHRLEAQFDEGVTRSSVEWIVPALACVMGDRGVRSPGKKPKGPRSIRGLRARGRPDG